MGRSFEQKLTEDLDLAGDLLRKKSARETCADCSFKTMRVCRTLSADYPRSAGRCQPAGKWLPGVINYYKPSRRPSPAASCRRPVLFRAVACRKSAAPLIPRSKRTETWPR